MKRKTIIPEWIEENSNSSQHVRSQLNTWSITWIHGRANSGSSGSDLMSV